MANVWSENNVTATLDYKADFVVTLEETVTVLPSVSSGFTTPAVIVGPPVLNPIDLIELLQAIFGILSFVLSVIALLGLLRWWKKHRKSRTRIDASPELLQRWCECCGT